jgi:hypothetical protein
VVVGLGLFPGDLSRVWRCHVLGLGRHGSAASVRVGALARTESFTGGADPRGQTVRSITFFIFGGVSYLKGEARTLVQRIRRLNRGAAHQSWAGRTRLVIATVPRPRAGRLSHMTTYQPPRVTTAASPCARAGLVECLTPSLAKNWVTNTSWASG